MKKALSLLLALTMIVGLLPATLAVDEATTAEIPVVETEDVVETPAEETPVEAPVEEIPGTLLETETTEPAEEPTAVASLDELLALLDADNKLTKNVKLTGGLVIPAGETFILDLNGKTVTAEDVGTNYSTTEGVEKLAVITNKGTLTIKDTAGGGKIVATYTKEVRAIDNASTGVLNLEGGTISVTVKDTGAYGVFTKGTVTIGKATLNVAHVFDATAGGNPYGVAIQGGTCTINEGANITATSNAAREAMAIYMSGSSQMTVTINGGTVKAQNTSTSSAYALRYGCTSANSSLTVKGGTFTASGAKQAKGNNYPLAVYGKNVKGKVVVDGGTFYADGNNASSSSNKDTSYCLCVRADTTANSSTVAAVVTVNGGTFKADGDNIYGINASAGTVNVNGGEFLANAVVTISNSGKVSITAGKISNVDGTAFNDAYKFLADGLAQDDAGNVIPEAAAMENIEVDGVKYWSVVEAAANVASDGSSVVKLLRDVKFVGTAVPVHGCTLDLNTYTLATVYTNAWDIKCGTSDAQKIHTIKNGTIDGGKSAVCWRSGALIVDNAVLVARSGMSVQILNHLAADKLAADYKNINVIKNSTLFSATYYVLSFNSSSNDFSNVSLRIENSELITNSKNPALACAGVTKNGEFVLGMGVTLYSKYTDYKKTADPALAISGQSVTLVGEEAAHTVTYTTGGTQYSGLTKWGTPIATVTTNDETTTVSGLAPMLDALDPSGNSVVTLLTDVRCHESVSSKYSYTLNLNDHIWYQYTRGSAVNVAGVGTDNHVTYVYNGTILNKGVGVPVRVDAGSMHLNDVLVYSLSTMPVASYVPQGDAYNADNLIENSTLISNRFYAYSNRSSDKQTNVRMKFENSNIISLYTGTSTGSDVFMNGNAGTTGAFVLGKNVNLYTQKDTAKVLASNTDGTPLEFTDGAALHGKFDAATDATINAYLKLIGEKLCFREAEAVFSGGTIWSYEPNLYKWTTNHTYAEATCEKPETCSCGLTQGEAKGHDYTYADTGNGTHRVICANDEAHNTVVAHTFENGECVCGAHAFTVTVPGSSDPSAFKSFEEALSAAGETGKITVFDSATLTGDGTFNGTLDVAPNAVLELNGKILQVGAMGVVAGKITDTTNGDGLLKVTEGTVSFDPNNPQIPIWDNDEGGYRLTNVEHRQGSSDSWTEGGSFTYTFRFDLANTKWNDLFLANQAKSGEDFAITAGVDVLVDGEFYNDYVISDATCTETETYIHKIINNPSGGYRFTLTGAENAGSVTIRSWVKIGGVKHISSEKTYTNPSTAN